MKIFLSYSSRQQTLAEQLYLELEHSGHSVFLDKKSLKAGGDFRKSIRSDLDQSEVFIFLISPSSVAGNSYARSELEIAREKWPQPEGHILPVMATATDLDSVPPYLKAVTILKPEGEIVESVSRRLDDWSPMEEADPVEETRKILVQNGTEGKTENRNITSGSKVNLKTKVSGEAILLEHFKLADAGLAIEFSKSNQMFLKVVGNRQQSLKNFIDFKKEVLERYTAGDLPPKFFIVSGVVVADKFYLRYSGKNGGTLGLNVKPNLPAGETELSGDFSIQWEKDVGYGVEGSEGGVLAYRVSAVRFNREKLPRSIQEEILNGKHEMTILEELTNAERKKVVHDGMIDLKYLTDELLNEDLAVGKDPASYQGVATLHESIHEMADH